MPMTIVRRTFFKITAAATALFAIRRSIAFAKGKPVSFDPMLSPWTGPHGGFPRFDQINTGKIEPGLSAGMDLLRKQIAAITDDKSNPTFENTLVPLEAAGREFGRASSVFGTYVSVLADKEVQALEAKMAPIL